MLLKGRVPGFWLCRVLALQRLGSVYGQSWLPQIRSPISSIFLQPALISACHCMVDTSQGRVAPKSVEKLLILGSLWGVGWEMG